MISLLSILLQIGIHATLGWNTKEVDEKVRDSVRDGKNRKVKMMLRYEWIYRKPEKGIHETNIVYDGRGVGKYATPLCELFYSVNFITHHYSNTTFLQSTWSNVVCKSRPCSSSPGSITFFKHVSYNTSALLFSVNH